MNSIADIVAEMRTYDPTSEGDGLRMFADRIEAAYKRERAFLETMRKAMAEHNKRASVGNDAAVREALETMVNCIDWLCEGDKTGYISKQFAPLLSQARAALSASANKAE